MTPVIARKGSLLAIVGIGIYVILRLWIIDYGTTINNLPHISAYQVNESIQASGDETIERAMLRFKLYSVEADEMVNILALSRIKPDEWKFDPQFYQYGGAWLYPLGVWYFILSEAGVLKIGSFNDVRTNPDSIDTVYVAGRIFVLMAVSLAAVFLYRTIILFSSPAISYIATAIFLTTPATIMFSQIIKPHWYALLWINICLYILVRGWVNCSLNVPKQLLIGLSLGLAVGSAATFSLFSIGVWLALAFMVSKKIVAPAALFTVPFAALTAYFASNPFVMLSWVEFRAESDAASGWFVPDFSLYAQWAFLENSFAPGFGVAFSLMLLLLLLKELFRKRAVYGRLLAVGVISSVVVVAILTGGIQDWHTHTRYLPWILPVGLLFMSASHRVTISVMGAVLLLGVVQAVPMALAYADENDIEFSTRLSAANWIEQNVDHGTTLCLVTDTPAPYDMPPIDIRNYKIGHVAQPYCALVMQVERQADTPKQPGNTYLLKRFRPRLSPEAFPLVFSHINPQISIYRRN